MHERHHDERTVEYREIAVVFNQAGDEEEPEQVLHNRTVACYRDMRIRRNRTHQEKADRDEQQQIGIHRRGTRAERRTLHRHVPQDVRKCSKHQALIPHGRHKRRHDSRHPTPSGQRNRAADTSPDKSAADRACRRTCRLCQSGRRLRHARSAARQQGRCGRSGCLPAMSAQFFDKPAQRCQNPRIDAVRRGTYRCRAEFIPQTAEHRAWVRLPDTVQRIPR